MWYNDSAEISSHTFVTSINKYERKDIYGRYVDIENFSMDRNGHHASQAERCVSLSCKYAAHAVRLVGIPVLDVRGRSLSCDSVRMRENGKRRGGSTRRFFCQRAGIRG